VDLQLRGKRAFVSGSTSGIGEAIARALAAEGVAVAVHGRREAEAVRVAREIDAAGGRAVVAVGDLANDAAARAVADQALRALGGIDILVNNAGAPLDKSWFETSAAEWTALFNQNVGSMTRMILHFVPGMKERRWGRVITVASIPGPMPLPAMAAYSATKAANINLAAGLARELAGTGVTSNSVSPGPIRTPALERVARALAAQMGWPEDWSEIEQRFIQTVLPNPCHRVGRVEEVADLATFLASPRAGYINGANIRIDGGCVPTVN
jgi:NAD(P)-dependent dehydrogenase (short-subunit alcohol dehydrogenase family)